MKLTKLLQQLKRENVLHRSISMWIEELRKSEQKVKELESENMKLRITIASLEGPNKFRYEGREAE